jgi:glutathione reductase (NADPH)
MAKYDYDLITIGAGSGGVRASRRASSKGKKVAIIENMRIGGTCVMRGCVPKKLLVIAGHFGDDFEDALGYGWAFGKPSFKWADLITAKSQELDRLERVYHKILKDSGVKEISGTGKLKNTHTIDVDGKLYTTENILISTGGWPHLPNVPGIEHAITSNEALDLKNFPNRVAIVGGGYIAVEFAGIFNALGSKVTEIIRGPQILRGFDEDVQISLTQEMKKKGITILPSCQVQSIEKAQSGLLLHSSLGDVIEVDQILYATGRKPKSDNIGLEDVGIELNSKGAIKVDEFSKTTIENIYAIGDVTDRMNLTPVALAEGEAFARTLFDNKPTPINYANIPSAVFSQPPIGSVGLTEEEAVHQAGSSETIDVYLSSFRPMKYTLSGRDEKTTIKMIVDAKTDIVLGCHMVGQDAPEIIQGVAVAIKCGAKKAEFDATIGIHPTSAEEIVTMREKRKNI